MIESASNVTIVYSHFLIGDLGKDEEPNYVIKFYNTGSLFMTETHFGFHNQNGTSHSGIIPSTNLGLRIENVSMVELKYCSFNGIKAEKSSGSAMFLQNTEVLMISCQFYLNMAKYGVIFGTDFVSITSINSSYISNYAGKSGAVFYLTNSCSLTNDGSVFQNNSARKNAGVVYAMYDITINNSGCLFQHNSAETGSGGVIWMQNNCKLTNKQVSVLDILLISQHYFFLHIFVLCHKEAPIYFSNVFFLEFGMTLITILGDLPQRLQHLKKKFDIGRSP